MIRFASAFAVFVATQAGAQLLPASSSDIAAAVGACLAAHGPEGVNRDRLVSAGWSDDVRDAKERPANLDFRIFSSIGNRALIFVTSPQSGRGACIASARISDFAAYEDVADAISQKANSSPFNRDGNSVRWRSGPFLVQLEATGSSEAPSVRAATILVSEGKQ